MIYNFNFNFRINSGGKVPFVLNLPREINKYIFRLHCNQLSFLVKNAKIYDSDCNKKMELEKMELENLEGWKKSRPVWFWTQLSKSHGSKPECLHIRPYRSVAQDIIFYVKECNISRNKKIKKYIFRLYYQHIQHPNFADNCPIKVRTLLSTHLKNWNA